MSLTEPQLAAESAGARGAFRGRSRASAIPFDPQAPQQPIALGEPSNVWNAAGQRSERSLNCPARPEF